MARPTAPSITDMARAFRRAAQDPDAFRSVMAASRAVRGDTAHEVAKAQAMTAAFGEKA